MNFGNIENRSSRTRTPNPEMEKRREERRRISQEVQQCSSLENGNVPNTQILLDNLVDGREEKFICFLGTEKNPGIFIVTDPGVSLHKNILENFITKTNYEGLVSGGGKIIKQGKTFTLFGTSTAFDRFNEEKTEYALRKGLPADSEIIIEQDSSVY